MTWVWTFSTTIAIIRACKCWALFVVTLTNTVHLIYIYIYISDTYFSVDSKTLLLFKKYETITCLSTGPLHGEYCIVALVLEIYVHFIFSVFSHDDAINVETFSTLLAICAGNSPVTGEFPAQRPVMWSVDVFFDLLLNKRLSKQWRGWWFETPSPPLWRQCNVFNDPVIIWGHHVMNYH